MRETIAIKKECILDMPESKADHQTGEEGRYNSLSPRASKTLDLFPSRIDGRVWKYTDADAISRHLLGQ
jgi:hypothetical protein